MDEIKMMEGDVRHLSKTLRNVDFFAGMKMGELELVLQYMLMFRYEKGENVCAQGEDGDAFYIVRDGSYGVWVKPGFFSFSRKVATLGDGEFFGEMALVTSEPRNATVTCESAGRVYVLTSGNFAFVLKKNPAFRNELKQIIEQRKFKSKQQGK